MAVTTSIFGRHTRGASIALVAFCVAAGIPQGARADDVEALAPTSHDMIVAPIVEAVNALALRISHLEETVSLITASFNSQRVAARQLCVSDESGAETCVTKAQLDGFLKQIAQAEVSEVAAVVAPAPEPFLADATTAGLSAPDLPIADAIVTEAQSTPITDATATSITDPAETAPTTEAITTASTAGLDEPEDADSTGGSVDGAALLWHPDVEVSVVVADPVPEGDAASDE